MNTLNIQPIAHDRIRIEVSDAADGVVVSFHGDIDMEDPGTILDPLFNAVHEGASAQKLQTVTADFTELNFLNSSGIKAIAKWIMKLGQNAGAYRIRLKYNKDITWQATSLQTLTFLVPGAVYVE